MTQILPEVVPVTKADRDLWKFILDAPYATCSRIDNLPDDTPELQQIARHRTGPGGGPRQPYIGTGAFHRARATVARSDGEYHLGCGGVWDQTDHCNKCGEPLASVDTLPKGQDAKQGLAGTEGSAVTPKAGDAQTPPKE